MTSVTDQPVEEYPREDMMEVVRKIEEIKELVPIRLLNGGYTYKDLESLNLNTDPVGLLKFMRDNGYLTEKPYETMLACPNCHDSNVVPILKCRSCNSLAIIRERLIEHKSGGHIHPESAFKRGEDQFICPSCNRVLKQDEYRTIGAWFVCLVCGERQANISPEFRCIKDGTTFTPVMSDIVMLYKYTLTDKAKSLLGLDKPMVVNAISAILSERGKVERNLSISGKSGVSHIFDIAYSKEGRNILIDVAFSNAPVGDTVVLTSFAKIFEVKGDEYLLIVWPDLSPSAQNLANFYKIKNIQAKSLGDITRDLKAFLDATPQP